MSRGWKTQVCLCIFKKKRHPGLDGLSLLNGQWAGSDVHHPVTKLKTGGLISCWWSVNKQCRQESVILSGNKTTSKLCWHHQFRMLLFCALTVYCKPWTALCPHTSILIHPVIPVRPSQAPEGLFHILKSLRHPSQSHCLSLREEFLHLHALHFGQDYTLLRWMNVCRLDTYGGAVTWK